MITGILLTLILVLVILLVVMVYRIKMQQNYNTEIIFKLYEEVNNGTRNSNSKN